MGVELALHGIECAFWGQRGNFKAVFHAEKKTELIRRVSLG
jgi:hypothetical protein